MKHSQATQNPLDLRFIKKFSSVVDSFEVGLRSLLASLPEAIEVKWSNEDSGLVMPGQITGGWPYNVNTIIIGIDSRLAEKDDSQTIEQLKRTIYHESVHLAQGFVSYDLQDHRIDTNYSVLEWAMSEGCASIFEREYASKNKQLPFYADYNEYDDIMLKKWLKVIQSLGNYSDEQDVQQWYFSHPIEGVDHIVYKVGAWHVDKALRAAGKSILDYLTTTSSQPLDFSM